jgi:SAM-dependent methyltransferase
MMIDGGVADGRRALGQALGHQRRARRLLEPHPAAVAILPQLHARGAKRVLDLGCGFGRHALLLASTASMSRRSKSEKSGGH